MDEAHKALCDKIESTHANLLQILGSDKVPSSSSTSRLEPKDTTLTSSRTSSSASEDVASLPPPAQTSDEDGKDSPPISPSLEAHLQAFESNISHSRDIISSLPPIPPRVTPKNLPEALRRAEAASKPAELPWKSLLRHEFAIPSILRPPTNTRRHELPTHFRAAEELLADIEAWNDDLSAYTPLFHATLEEVPEKRDTARHPSLHHGLYKDFVEEHELWTAACRVLRELMPRYGPELKARAQELLETYEEIDEDCKAVKALWRTVHARERFGIWLGRTVTVGSMTVRIGNVDPSASAVPSKVVRDFAERRKKERWVIKHRLDGMTRVLGPEVAKFINESIEEVEALIAAVAKGALLDSDDDDESD